MQVILCETWWTVFDTTNWFCGSLIFFSFCQWPFSCTSLPTSDLYSFVTCETDDNRRLGELFELVKILKPKVYEHESSTISSVWEGVALENVLSTNFKPAITSVFCIELLPYSDTFTGKHSFFRDLKIALLSLRSFTKSWTFKRNDSSFIYFGILRSNVCERHQQPDFLFQFKETAEPVEPCFNGTLVRADQPNKDVCM